jgi:phycocyanin-associated rod protein
MHGQTSIGVAANTEAGRRIFQIEVSGLRQSEESDKTKFAIRRSGSTFFTVPYTKMNEEMQRINRLGGIIISVSPLVI